MRIEMLPKIDLAGYDEFETVAQTLGDEIQQCINDHLSDGREWLLVPQEFNELLGEYSRILLPHIRPEPDEAGRKVAEKSLMFGAYLGVLFSKANQPVLATDSIVEAGDVNHMQIYVNYAPRRYLHHRPHIRRLIDRNLLQPTPGLNQAKLVRNMAGLAVMQCEEACVDAFLHQETEKIVALFESLDGPTPE